MPATDEGRHGQVDHGLPGAAAAGHVRGFPFAFFLLLAPLLLCGRGSIGRRPGQHPFGNQHGKKKASANAP